MPTVDAFRFEQVITNLLDNAIKYSPEGGPIEVELTQPAPDRVRIAVRDHGIGIPAGQEARIFERFFQAHRNSHRSGLGLGLYLSQQIVGRARRPADRRGRQRRGEPLRRRDPGRERDYR